ncbi:MAG: class I SAM-dependent methyltransferase [Trichlorobacter sp.]|jgi:SAM-dependent methyltransferase
MDAVRQHYEIYPYPRYPLLASIRRSDTSHLKLSRLWARWNGCKLPKANRQILIAGCGSFAPYPFSLANPDCRITALDLSAATIKRARLHCLLHLRLNVRFVVGNLLDSQTAPGPFGLIDAYGVLHHLPDPLAGLLALKQRMTGNGLLRIMLYSHGARSGTEAARRALRRLQVQDLPTLEALYKRLPQGSRLAERLGETPEGNTDHGLADAFLHPQVTVYRVAELKPLITASGLELLVFSHPGALTDTATEWQRLSLQEANGDLDTNFVLLLRKTTTA